MVLKQSINPKDYFLVCREDFSTFIGFTFSTLFPNAPYLHNWHIDAMAAQLMKCYQGECRRLIVTMPPRMLKSIVMSVAYPAWLLGHDPSMEIMCISYGDELVKDLGNKFQTLMQSERYRQVFPNMRLLKDHQSPSNIGLKGGGQRLAIPAGGSITGRGANVIIIDDPLKASDARTKQREIINTWYDDNMYQRLNRKNVGVIILVMQRLHLFDLAGYLLEKPEPWTHMNLPAIAEYDQEYELPDGNVYLRKAGDVLHPDLESRTMLETVKQNQGAYVFAAQYQQEPASDKEALIQKDWFVIVPPDKWPAINSFSYLYMSWDTANNLGEHNDYSVGILIGYVNKHYYILDVVRKKLEFPQLLKCITQYQQYQGRKVKIIVEDASSGKALIQALRDIHRAVHSFKPVGDKFIRLCAVSGLIESGFVHLPAGASWVDEFLLEVTRFPNSPHDDQVDALSQGLNYIHNLKRGLLDVG